MLTADLLTDKQLKKLQGGVSVSSFITTATRTSCRNCDGSKFKRIMDEDNIKIPICSNCGGRPKRYRVSFSIPKVGTENFQKVMKSKNEIGEPLDTLTKAKSFLSFIDNKLKLDGSNFDPREIGTEEDRKIFIVKHFSVLYEKFLERKEAAGELTPGGRAKKIGVLRNQINPLFGDYSIKQINYSLVERVLFEEFVSDSGKIEILKELKSLLKYACIRSIIQSVPELPKKPRQKTYKSEDFYTLEERDLVISNIKKRTHQIAITILAKYTRRQCEVRCLRWGDIDFRNREITFSRHISDGKGVTKTRELEGLKSSPDKNLVYDFFPGLHEMLQELTPSLMKNELVFKGRNEYMAKNVLWYSWTKSVDDLINRGLLTKRVDLHRGTRNSTLSSLYEAGKSEQFLQELYGGNSTTMKKHYAKKRKQSVSEFH